MIKTIAFVSCVNTKHNTPMPARDLYCSDWFKKGSAYAERIVDEWYVLSALYGFIQPDKIISPYEKNATR